MHRFFDLVTLPIIKLLAPATIVEIGALTGENTRKFLDACGDGTTFHVIDPKPLFDPETLVHATNVRVVFHKDISLNVIGKLPRFELGLIDGDHNWYTVFNELKAIEALHAGTQFPLLLFHDVGWPYGRRDLYYDVSNIPEQFRQPHKRAGMQFARKHLLNNGGLNFQLNNAVEEGGPRNGVLTAIEDFVAEASSAFELRILPALSGLGILASRARLEATPQLGHFLDELFGPAGLMRALALVEEHYCRAMVREHDKLWRIQQLTEKYEGNKPANRFLV